MTACNSVMSVLVSCKYYVVGVRERYVYRVTVMNMHIHDIPVSHMSST